MPAITAPKFDGVNVIGTNTNSFQVSIVDPPVWPGTTVTITNGDYFFHSHTGTPADGSQLVEQVTAFINAALGYGAGTVVVAATDTGGCTVQNNHGANPFSMRFQQHTGAGVVDIGVLLGLVVLSAAANPVVGPLAAAGGSFVGLQQHYNGWYPSRAPSTVLAPLDNQSLAESDTVVTTAPSGRTVSTSYSETRINAFTFENLTSGSVHAVPSGSTFNISYEEWWQRMRLRRFRYYRERDDRNGPTGAGPWTFALDDKTAKEGTTRAERTRAFYDALWKIRVGVRNYVA